MSTLVFPLPAPATIMLTAGLFVDKSAFFKNKEIGLQLYTVRSEVNNEKLASTIKTIAEAGYKNVELYGYDKRMCLILIL